MLDWNVVVTLHRSFSRGVRMLRRFGAVEPTGLYNVVVMRVPDVRQLLAQIAEAPDANELFTVVSHVVPVTRRFSFTTSDDLDHQARDLLRALAPELAGKTLHVRVRRRGHKGELHAHELEKRLGATVLDELARRGTPGRFTIDDPDVVIAIETVRDAAGLALWTRDDLERYPFVRRSIERGRQAGAPRAASPELGAAPHREDGNTAGWRG